MTAPIVPNFEYSLIDGQVVLVWMAVTAGGAGANVALSLPTHSPFIDIRLGHPVLSGGLVNNETSMVGEAYLQVNEMERGATADSVGEWVIVDHNSVTIDLTLDEDAFLGLSYIAFGGNRA